jgi:hypothetical protein
MLDRTLHPRGVLKLAMKTRGVDVKTGGPGFVIDAFQVDSLSAYLREQQNVRNVLEGELRKLSEGIAVADRKGAGKTWKHAKLLGIALYPRHVLGPEDRKKLKKLRLDLTDQQIDAEVDKPTTRTTFTVEVRVDWDDEHLYHLVIRDGAIAKCETA